MARRGGSSSGRSSSSRSGSSSSSRSSSRSSSSRSSSSSSSYSSSGRRSSSRRSGSSSGRSYRGSDYGNNNFSSGGGRSGCSIPGVIGLLITAVLGFLFVPKLVDGFMSKDDNNVTPTPATTIASSSATPTSTTGATGGSTSPDGSAAPDSSAVPNQNSDFFYDGAEWFSDPSAVKTGMQYFYEKTGVMPYIYLADTIYSESEAEDLLNELFDEQLNENYYVVLFMDNNDEYGLQSMTGTEAEKVIDIDDDNVILDYLEELYDSDMSNEEFIAEAFRRSADKIAS